MLSGIVFGTDGMGVSNIDVVSMINGQSETTSTDSMGRYSISVPQGANVTISPFTGLGVSVSPQQYSFSNVCESMSDLNFFLSAITPNVMGNMSDPPFWGDRDREMFELRRREMFERRRPMGMPDLMQR